MIKLRRINQIKFCVNCNEFVKIKMERLEGYCPNCKNKLYTMDNSIKSKDGE